MMDAMVAVQQQAFAPWYGVTGDLDGRLEAEIKAALLTLDAQAGGAGHMLDVAYRQANEARVMLQAAGWAAFGRYMDEAWNAWHDTAKPALEKHADTIAGASAKPAEQAMAAGRMLDMELARANTARAPIQAAAWAELGKWLAAADEQWHAVMAPAWAAYAAQTAQTVADFDAQLASASAAYKVLILAVNAGKTEAQNMSLVG
jgi:hypothetical protein